uniref:Uncharacterized protein n=1 Tax=Anguilla anguilla TaxID=7936 RepID=A0A0E9VWX3_ANGAN
MPFIPRMQLGLCPTGRSLQYYTPECNWSCAP